MAIGVGGTLTGVGDDRRQATLQLVEKKLMSSKLCETSDPVFPNNTGLT